MDERVVPCEILGGAMKKQDETPYRTRLKKWRKTLKVGDLRVVYSLAQPHLWDEDDSPRSPHCFVKDSIFMILDINKNPREKGEWEFTILTSHGILFIADGHLEYSTRELV